MPLVDYRLAGLDPWKKYEENREYLLRKAAIDENISSSRASGERANRQLALASETLGFEKEQFAERQKMNADKIAQAEAMQKQANQLRAQEMFKNQASFLANSLSKSTPENYSLIRENVLNTMFKSIDAGPGTTEEKLAAKNRISSETPEVYDEKYVNDALKTLYGQAETKGILPVYMQSANGGTAISFVDKTNVGTWQPPQGWSIVSKDKFDALNSDGKKAEYDTNGKGGYTKAQVIDDTRAYYRDKARSLMDPEMPDFIKDGPQNDPDKYRREHEKIMQQMDLDLVNIEKGKLPSWLKEKEKPVETPEPISTSVDEDISKYLKK